MEKYLSFDFLFQHQALSAGVAAMLMVGISYQLIQQHSEQGNATLLAENKISEAETPVYTPAAISKPEQAPELAIASEPAPLSSSSTSPAPSLPSKLRAKKLTQPNPVLAQADIATPLSSIPAAPATPPMLAQVAPAPASTSAQSMNDLSRTTERAKSESSDLTTGDGSSINIVVSASKNIQAKQSKQLSDAIASASTTMLAKEKLNEEVILESRKIDSSTMIENKIKSIQDHLLQQRNKQALQEWETLMKDHPKAIIPETTLKQLIQIQKLKNLNSGNNENPNS